MRFILIAALCATATAASCANIPSSVRDIARAATTEHSGLVSAGSVEEIAEKINAQISREHGELTKCADFEIEELNELISALLCHADEGLHEALPVADSRRRRLSTVTDYALEWAEELQHIAADPSLETVIKEGKCAEALMLFIHHVSEGHRRELGQVMRLPELPTFNHEHITRSTNHKVAGRYLQQLNCISGHNIPTATDDATDHVFPHWPAEVHWIGQGHGAYPFWACDGGPGGGGGGGGKGPGGKAEGFEGRRQLQYNNAMIETWWSEKQGHELFYHEDCSCNSDFNNGPCWHLMLGPSNAKVSYLWSDDETYCCDSTGRGQPLTAPQSDFMDIFPSPVTLNSYSADYYSGPAKWYVMDGVDGPVTWFWYVTDMDGNPVEQGEGGKSNSDSSGAGVHIWHSYRNFTAESIPASTFAIPSICQNTRNTCNGV